MAKTMRAALSEHYPNAAEKDILKVRLFVVCLPGSGSRSYLEHLFFVELHGENIWM